MSAASAPPVPVRAVVHVVRHLDGQGHPSDETRVHAVDVSAFVLPEDETGRYVYGLRVEPPGRDVEPLSKAELASAEESCWFAFLYLEEDRRRAALRRTSTAAEGAAP
jgi:hypothetical protein